MVTRCSSYQDWWKFDFHYGFRFPEAFFPGKFDVFFHSHQIFHVLHNQHIQFTKCKELWVTTLHFKGKPLHEPYDSLKWSLGIWFLGVYGQPSLIRCCQKRGCTASRQRSWTACCSRPPRQHAQSRAGRTHKKREPRNFSWKYRQLLLFKKPTRFGIIILVSFIILFVELVIRYGGERNQNRNKTDRSKENPNTLQIQWVNNEG